NRQPVRYGFLCSPSLNLRTRSGHDHGLAAVQLFGARGGSARPGRRGDGVAGRTPHLLRRSDRTQRRESRRPLDTELLEHLPGRKAKEMKRTPLYDEHVKLRARLIPFGGFDMPVQYESILKEHEAVRNRAGLFDLSHMGQFILEGDAVAEWADRLTVNAVP